MYASDRSKRRKLGGGPIFRPQLFLGVKKTFNAADYVAPHAIFNIGGNKFRPLAIIDFDESVEIVRAVMTHREYDKWKP